MIPAAAASLVPLLSTCYVTGPELGSGSGVGWGGSQWGRRQIVSLGKLLNVEVWRQDTLTHKKDTHLSQGTES